LTRAPSVSAPDAVYCDDCLLVASKPAGLLAVPGRGEDKQDCFSARIQDNFADALVVHRLDMATSGLMVFGRGAEMQAVLSRMFRERKVSKRYAALVAGRMAQDEGKIELPVICDWPNRPRQRVDHDVGKHSLTYYRALTYDEASDSTRLELEPVTGRTHQLRVHMAAIGHPIIGDALYGGRPASRLMLHAAFLSFPHPRAGGTLRLVSEPPF